MRENQLMGNNYQIEIFRPNDGVGSARYYAQAFGDLDVIGYIAKKVSEMIKDVTGNIVLSLNEVDAIGGQKVREVVAVTAGARVVATVLKGELTAERKAAKSVSPADAMFLADRDSERETADEYANGDQDPEDGPTGVDQN